MAIHVALTHRTEYRYDRLVAMAPHTIRLRPAPHCRTPILAYSLKITPKEHFINWQQDPFGNFLARIVIPEKTQEFSVTVDLVADMAVINPFDFFIDESVRDWPFTYDAEIATELAPYLEPMDGGPRLDGYMRALDRKGTSTLDFICDLNRQLASEVKYLIRMEPGVQTPDETLTLGSGSCRDTGWLLVQILRRLGVAARFVSGYLIQLKPDVKSLDGPVGADADFTDLHAWAEAYIPGAGWIGLDPTSGLLAGEGHIPLAATPKPSSAAPISGAHDKAEVDFNFDMHVQRVLETPRVTLPYSDVQWSDIVAAGHAVDKRLVAGNVRLTMGGEPTFVSIDDMDGAEWNNAAVGPTKQGLAENLVRRLRDRFAPGGMLHYGQGKWYPGEQLPRWSYSIYWRTDREPLWENPDLIDREVPKVPASVASAEKFVTRLCTQLGLPADSAIPAYEDAGYFSLAEQKLPIGVDPKNNKLEDPIERARLVGVFSRGITKPTGYVLPIQVWNTQDRGRRWVTERWKLRRDRLYLNPGDSPIGLRLPLGSLPYIAAIDLPRVEPRDPFDPGEPLPDRRTLQQRRRTVALEAPPVSGWVGTNDVGGSVRTALAVEPRNGHLCVFLPPVQDAEDYAALVAAIEDAAASSGNQIRLEGYTPPFDRQLSVIKVTPDPGVIEVNVHPANNWGELVDITTGLYEDARLCRLGTEKFMLDGRHTGTGGGNHIVLGGTTPQDSPFLRRPDVLASVVAYWQNHPSLSYLFSGLFIGPTSQAPRMDEARNDQLYELELALQEVHRSRGFTPPWLVDRIFRNLLVDVTGNTHRAEICIDKLYSPDGPTGRLGLVEFRSFEMPPHAQMSLAQQLLVRALIAWFWEQPYRRPLVKWGTALHDRFMLPHFVWQDFKEIIGDLNTAGFSIHADWFAPHREFRFPRIGTIQREGLTVEIRQALEPWHVLGEEGVPGGTARYVDSSLERVQVKVDGQAGDRFAVTCNGFEIPMTATGKFGECVAGVRYRAWNPASCLHPTVGRHVPLTFDVVDKWNGRSIGGCRYHVEHPGGRNLEIFPVNSYEAEGRRLARFEDIGHTAGASTPQRPGVHPDFPLTLDMRRL